MTHSTREFADLPLSTVLLIDKVADDFETAMSSGNTPSIDAYLERLHAPSDGRLREFIKSSGGDFKVDPLSRQTMPAVHWNP